MWDPHTSRVIVMHDVIWLKHMHFQPDNVARVLELEDVQDVLDDIEDVCADSVMSDASVTPLKSGGNVTWHDPVVTVPTTSSVTQSG